MKRFGALAALACLTASAAHATGPENWIIVVNADNADSVAVAEEYARLRQIPAGNLIRLRNLSDHTAYSVEEFRRFLLIPVLTAIRERGLTAQVDGIAYAPGLPYAISVDGDIGEKKLAMFQTKMGSLTGMTYLYERVLKRDPDYLDLDTNTYARKISVGGGKLPNLTELLARTQAAPPEGTSEDAKKWLAEAAKLASSLKAGTGKSAEVIYNLACALALAGRADDAMLALTAAAEAGWMNAALTEADTDLTSLRTRPDFKALVLRMQKVVAKSEPPAPFHNVSLYQGRRFLLSAMLGFVRENTESREQVLSRLRRSVAADGTRPTGTIYYMASTDWARTGPRKWAFDSAVSTLAPLGVKAVNLPGVLPPQGAKVAGVMVGAHTFDWKSSGATLVPGAFCDHLTSLGGAMLGEGQTLLTEFLKNGAAGACGTVVEPYNVPGKFPTAFVHYYYASGATLAEAFYQSVTGPYQQLLIGDPLCRPWGAAPPPKVSGLKDGEELSAPRSLVVKATGAVRVELYVDGIRRQTAPPGKPLMLDPKGLEQGAHELRVVSVVGPLEATSRTILRFAVR